MIENVNIRIAKKNYSYWIYIGLFFTLYLLAYTPLIPSTTKMEIDQLQKFVLSQLNSEGEIKDSRELYYQPVNRKLNEPNDSNILQSSLQGLQSKEVCLLLYPVYTSNIHPDDRLH